MGKSLIYHGAGQNGFNLRKYQYIYFFQSTGGTQYATRVIVVEPSSNKPFNVVTGGCQDSSYKDSFLEIHFSAWNVPQIKAVASFTCDFQNWDRIYNEGVQCADGTILNAYQSSNTSSCNGWIGIYREEGPIFNYLYTGAYQTFTVPKNGTYRFELWGASGLSGGSRLNPGCGGYCKGDIYLSKNTKFYIYVGGQTVSNGFTFNGGANGEAPGGGATDVRLVDGSWDNFDSLKSRIIVAAGGGGAVYSGTHSGAANHGGHAGGLSGERPGNTVDLSYAGYGATQTAGGGSGSNSGNDSGVAGGFGYGGGNTKSSGGGGGYYGGGHGVHPGSSWTGGGGGSSFISGYTGCNALTSTATSSNRTHSGNPEHYSGYIFSNMSMIAGSATMIQPDGVNYETGHTGTGQCKITLL